MNARIEKLQAEIADLRQQLVEHPLYAQIQTLEDFQYFMEQHIFAVLGFHEFIESPTTRINMR